jgi:Tfp pilus assembly protein PilF
LLVNSSEEDRSRFVFFGLLCLVLTGIVVYSHILHAPFVFDDYSSVVDNETIKNLSSSLRNTSDTRYVTLLSFALNHAAGGTDPFGYHLVNVLIHVLNAILVYYLVLVLCKSPKLADTKVSRQFIAFSTAFIFVAHPVQTQAVTYIAQRATSLATFFYLFSLVMYVKARICQIAVPGTKNRNILRIFSVSSMIFFLISVVFAVLAIKSKQIAITLPAMIILLELCFFTGPFHANRHVSKGKRLLIVALVSLIVVLVLLSVFSISLRSDNLLENIDAYSRETERISRTDYLLTQFRVIVTYLRILIFPVKQSVDYTFPVYNSFLNIKVLISFLLLVCILGFAIYLFLVSRRKNYELRLMAFGLFWFFIALSVESSIIPIRDVIFEHRLYLPSIGFFITALSAIDYLVKRPKIKLSAIVIVLCLLSIGTYNRNTVWQTPQTLWEDVLRKFPDNVRAYNGLGVIYKQKGEYAKAAEYFEQGLLINKRYAPFYYNLGDIQYQVGKHEDAVRYFQKALGFTSGYYMRLDIMTSLGIAYSEMGNNREALNAFKKTVSHYPTEIYPRSNLARQYLMMGDPDSAIRVLEEALKIKEAPHLYHKLSAAYKLKGEIKKSKYYRQKALDLD